MDMDARYWRHRNSIALDFSAIALSDDEPIYKALDIVCSAGNHHYLPAEMDILNRSISRFIKGETVGYLRWLSDNEWNQFNLYWDDNNYPLLCRIYLKRLILQSHRLTKQQQLECDFNYGFKFPWSCIQDQIKQLSLRFTQDELYESFMVAQNNEAFCLQSFSSECLTSYLAMNKQGRIIKYGEAKRCINQDVPFRYHWTAIECIKQTRKQILQWQKMDNNQLSLQIEKLKSSLNDAKFKRMELQKQADEIRHKLKLQLYKEYIRALIVGQIFISDIFMSGYIRKQQMLMRQIIPHEIGAVISGYVGNPEHSINVEKNSHMDRYKCRKNITYEDHVDVLHELGYNVNMFDKLKSYESVSGVWDDFEYCVVCYEPPRDYMILPCNHVCLNRDCAEESFPAPYDGQRCPLCDIQIEEVKQVFYF